MSEIDKLFKNKLDQRTFEFKDSYWEEAEALIDAQEKDRRRIGFLWWSGLLVLGAVVLGATFWYVQPDKKVMSVEKLEMVDVLGNQNQNQNQNQNEALVAKSNEAEVEESIQTRVMEPALKTEELNSTNSKPTNNQPSIKKTTQPKSPNSLLSYEKAIAQTKASLPQSPAKPAEGENTSILPGEATASKPEVAEIVDVQRTNNEVDAIIALETLEVTSIDELALLDTKKEELDIPEASCEDCFDLKKSNFQPKRFHFGLTVESIYNIQKSNGVQKTNNGFSGVAIGGFVNYRLGRQLSLNLGLQYAVSDYKRYDFKDEEVELTANGGFDPTVDLNRIFQDNSFYAQNELYGFGLQTYNESLTLNSYHHLEIPLTIQWQKKRHLMDAGIQLNYLLGVRGDRLASFVGPSLPGYDPTGNPITIADYNAEVKENQNVWLPKDPFKTVTCDVKLGYEFLLNRHLGLHFSAQYQLNNTLFDNSNSADNADGVFSNIAENSVFKNTNRLQLRLGAKWRF